MYYLETKISQITVYIYYYTSSTTCHWVLWTHDYLKVNLEFDFILWSQIKKVFKSLKMDEMLFTYKTHCLIECTESWSYTWKHLKQNSIPKSNYLCIHVHVCMSCQYNRIDCLYTIHFSLEVWTSTTVVPSKSNCYWRVRYVYISGL